MQASVFMTKSPYTPTGLFPSKPGSGELGVWGAVSPTKRKKGFFSKLLGGNLGSVEWYENWLSKLNKKYSAFDNAMKTLEGYISDIATLISDDYDPDYGPIHIQVYDDMEIGIIPPDPSNVVGVGQTRRGSQTYNDTASDVGDSGSDLGDTMSGDDGGE